MDKCLPPEAWPGRARGRGGVGAPPLTGYDGGGGNKAKGKEVSREVGESLSRNGCRDLFLFFCFMGYLHG